MHKERLTSRDIGAIDFFEILVASGSVTIVNSGAEILRTSILRVEKNPGDIYEMSIDTFIRLTEPMRGMVGSNIDAYIIPAFNSIGMQIGMITEAEDVFTESILDEEGAEVFHAESIRVVSENGEFYTCFIDNFYGESMGFTPDDFTNPENISVLYLFCHAHQAYF